MNKCASVIGHFDGHDDAPVRCQAHRPMKHVQGYLRSHWTPPSGKYSSRITPVDAMVIDFGVKIELWCCEIAVPKLAFKSQSVLRQRQCQPVSRKVHVGQKGGKQIQDPLLVTLLRGMEGTLRFFFSLMDFA